MKTNTTVLEIDAIIDALKKLHVYPFRSESSDPKYDAQRNLNGKTHYVDDGTLRWHKSRVVGTRILHGGLLLRVTCSDALDMNNTKRGFRSAVFDVFGTIVSRPKLENSSKTHQKAIEVSDAEEIDLVEHYRCAINQELKLKQDYISELQTALAVLPKAA